MKEESKCPKCGALISGHGYQMPGKCEQHIRESHPDDYKVLEDLKNQLSIKRKEFGDQFWFFP